MDDHPALYDVRPELFENPTTPEVAYILGYLWADGHLDVPTNSIILDCVAEDMDAIEKAFDSTGEWLKGEMSRPGKRKSRIFRTINARLARFLLAHGFEKKSTRSPDSLVALVPIAVQHYFWRGYFDGDGCIYSVKNVTIAGSYQQDWNAWEKLLKSLNIYYDIQHRTYGTHRGSVIHISMQRDMLVLLDFMYRGFEADKIGLPRKHAAYLALKSHIAKRPLSNVGYIGVHKANGKFVAKIGMGSRKLKVQTYIGYFNTAIEAARAYDKRAIELRGIRARTNFPHSDYVGSVNQAA